MIREHNDASVFARRGDRHRRATCNSRERVSSTALRSALVMSTSGFQTVSCSLLILKPVTPCSAAIVCADRVYHGIEQRVYPPGARPFFDLLRWCGDVAVLQVVSQHTQCHEALRITDGEQNFVRT